eukprot:8453148-Alexandrium_andersonii.AAC.1
MDDLVAFRTGASKGIYVRESLELVKDDRTVKTFEFPAFRGDPVVPPLAGDSSASPRGPIAL